MKKLDRVLAEVTRDGRITNDEWDNDLKPLVEQLPHRCSSDGDRLVRAWAESAFDCSADGGMRRSLREMGYGVTPYSKHTEAVADLAIAQNPTREDETFERLSQLTGTQSASEPVAVLDTCFELDHPLLDGKRFENVDEVDDGEDTDGNGFVGDTYGWDFVDHDRDPAGMGETHGTFVAGLATQGTDRLPLLPLRVMDDKGHGEVRDIIPAIEYAAARGVRVINISIGFTDEEVAPMLEAIARHPDVTFILGAGNDTATLGQGRFAPDRFLAANDLTNMVVVSSGDDDAQPKKYNACYGAAFVDVAAYDAPASAARSSYTVQGGTSFAAPQVTNVVAKCLTLCPDLTPNELKHLVRDTADSGDAWKDLVKAGGFYNRDRALTLAALIGLTRRGSSPDKAADQIALQGSERRELLRLLPRYMVRAAS